MYYETSIIPYMNEVITDVLAEYFDIKFFEKGHYWFTQWDNHCRKVITVYAIKGTLWPIYWGYNYDFIPWEKNIFESHGKLVYHRTEKAVFIDVGGTPFPYIDYMDFYSPSLRPDRDHGAIRRKYFVPTCGPDAEWAKKNVGEIVRRNIPFMLDWFQRISTMDNVIDNLNQEIKTTNGFPYRAYWVRGFLYAKQHRIDEAIADIQCVYDRYDTMKQIPENVLKKLYEADQQI